MARRNAGMRIRVDGINEVIRALQEANSAIEKELRDLISECAELVFRTADANIPIDTSRARYSLKIDVGENNKGLFYAQVIVGSSSGANKGTPFYITFHELGSSRQPAKPFMRPALTKNKAKIRKRLIEGLKGIIEAQGR